MAGAGQWGIRIAAILLALVVGGLVILLSGNNPIQGYAIIVEGPGQDLRHPADREELHPLLGTALAIAPCFKMRFWNIGRGTDHRRPCAPPISPSSGPTPSPRCPCCSSCAPPAHRRRPVGAGARLLQGPLGNQRDSVHPDDELHHHRRGEVAPGRPVGEDPQGSQQIEQFASNACLPRVAGVYCGWIVVLALTVFMFIYMKYTKHGYEIAVIGESENTARYAGMNVGWVIMRTMFLSGPSPAWWASCWSPANNTLYSGVAAGAGFTAITVAWLAQLNPFAMVGISALLAVLQKGADTLNTQMGIPASLSDVITGVLLFFMLGCEFFINYKLVFRGAEERHKRKEAAK